MSNLISIPVQCSHEIPAWLYEKPQPLTSAAPDPAQPRAADHSFRHLGCTSAALAEGMSKLSMDIPYQRQQDVKTEMLNPFVFNLESSKRHEASSTKPKPSKENGAGESRAQYTAMVSVFSTETCGLYCVTYNLCSRFCFCSDAHD